MKRILSLTLIFTILITLSFSVFAAEPATVKNDDGSWTTSGENAAFASSYMTLVAITAAPISVNSIQYIYQTRADDNGKYYFESYLPTQNPQARVPYIVLVSGEKLDAPINAGTIFTEVEDVMVNGTVSKTGTLTGATIRLLNEQGQDVLEEEGVKFATNAADGSFSFVVAPGTYTLEITKSGHTKYVYEGIVLEKGKDIKNASYTIYAGEVTNDGEIATPDILKIIRNFTDSVTDEQKPCDLTEDSVIDIKDITALIANTLKKDVTEKAQAAQ